MDVRWLSIAAVVLLITVGTLIFVRKPMYVTTGRVFIPNPANDSLVICQGWDEKELTKILADFEHTYQNRLPSAQPFSVEAKRDAFRIRFPGDIAPPLFSYLVNYLQYPKDFDVTNRRIAVVGVVTLTKAFPIPSDDYVGKQARVYVPSNDRQYDEAYIEVGSEYFRQSFTDMAWRRSSDGRVPDAIKELR